MFQPRRLRMYLFVVENVKAEGSNSLDEYKEALTSIHHGGVWDLEQIVWAHELKEK